MTGPRIVVVLGAVDAVVTGALIQVGLVPVLAYADTVVWARRPVPDRVPLPAGPQVRPPQVAGAVLGTRLASISVDRFEARPGAGAAAGGQACGATFGPSDKAVGSRRAAIAGGAS